MAAGLIGLDDEYFALLERLYQLCVDGGEPRLAARAAFWLGFRLIGMREIGRAGGWFSRSQRLLENDDCVEKGYLLLPMVQRLVATGDYDGALAAAVQATAIGDRFRDPDLGAFARSTQARVLLRQGQVERGLALLDEAMVAVAAGALNPVLAGLTYCTAIACCN